MLESVCIVFGIYNFEADMQRCCCIATAMMDRQGTRVKSLWSFKLWKRTCFFFACYYCKALMPKNIYLLLDRTLTTLWQLPVNRIFLSSTYYRFNKSQNSRTAENGLFEIVSIWLKVSIALTFRQAFAGKDDNAMQLQTSWS